MSKTCSVDGCPTAATAKGMCAKHRMRVLRTGSAADPQWRGRPPSMVRASVQATFAGDWSPKTISRYWIATQTIWELFGYEGVKGALTKAIRPNGTVNVAVLQREADMAVARWVRENS